jgi:hypothetical protein
MTPARETTPRENIEQSLLDRLVDGELSDVEQRELLTRLDRADGGWRRLALTFVESQSLGKDFRELLGTARPNASTMTPTGARSARVWTPANIMLAACCAGLLAGVGLTWHQFPGSSRVGGPVEKETAAPQEVAATDWRQTVRVNTASLAGSGVEVPLMNVSDVNPDWLNSRSGVPRHVREALLESGQEFEETRRLIPFQLEDGRWGVLPVDEVHFVDPPAFQ